MKLTNEQYQSATLLVNGLYTDGLISLDIMGRMHAALLMAWSKTQCAENPFLSMYAPWLPGAAPAPVSVPANVLKFPWLSRL